jgi:transcriptional regulator with XRE-family HTH domain
MTHSGIFLKEIRKKLSLSQQEMAEKLGITKQSISKIETGTNDLSKNLISNLVSCYNVNPNYLLTGKGEIFQDIDLFSELGCLMLIPKEIKKIRFENELSQQKFADLLGVTKQYISDIETGKSPVSEKISNKIQSMFFADKIKKNQDINNAIKEKLNLTEDEFKLLIDALHKDKPICLVLFQAINGDVAALERLKKIIN